MDICLFILDHHANRVASWKYLADRIDRERCERATVEEGKEHTVNSTHDNAATNEEIVLLELTVGVPAHDDLKLQGSV